MQYDDIKPVFKDKSELRALCVQTGLPAKEVVKRALRSTPSEIELWNRAHTEAGILTNLERKDVEYGYQVIATFQKQNPNPRFGGSEKENRSIFFNDGGVTFDKWNELLGERCIFYIAYSKNEEDGSAYRNLVDIEKATSN